MQAAGQGTGGAAGDADGPGGPGDPGGPGGYAGGPGEAGAASGGGTQGIAAPRASGPERVSGPGGGVPRGPRGGPASRLNGCCSCGTRRPDSRLLEFYLTMPFPTPMEAELAHRSLARDAPPLPMPGVLLKEFTVSGNILTIRLIAADHRQLQLSISSCFQQLSLLMWITQCFLPVFLARPPSGQRR
ncbi:cancer/testis antigen 1-like [Theropithecus gelada]|uniref:cancer/testis antigen 1-like n=1 Tax=Theropithecus gelada TaxID=9565 RepID=UPI000DC16077|nr:cancer/testis antigen 1-like [Theropithecus gelada]XP_025228359.1 cancer/testis antigen 1-like [Theropithecus gelada]